MFICEYFLGFILKYLFRLCSKKMIYLYDDFEFWGIWVIDVRNKDNLRELMF